MIFVTLGSQKFQFNRLLKEIDRLIEENEITEEVFAQIGYSDYIPKNYNYKKFLDREEFNEFMNRCDRVITHGGTGAIIGALRKEKKVIAIPRLAKYDEHVDDHQVEIVEVFNKKQMILGVCEMSELKDSFTQLEFIKFKPFVSNTENVINSIESYIGGRQ